MKDFNKLIYQKVVFQFLFFIILVGLIFNSCISKSDNNLKDFSVKLIKDYSDKTKSEYNYKILDSTILQNAVLYHVKMTSGKWLSNQVVSDSIWWHIVDIVVPRITTSNNALLFIGGGTKFDQEIFLDSLTIQKAIKIKSVIAHVSNIPFQPIVFKDSDTIQRYEDNLIAYGWDRFLSGGAKDNDTNFLARFPMTRAVVRSMDLIQEITINNFNPIEKFFISGASKRGWTTWTTAAIDSRIMGMAPLVIDMLNLIPSFHHHFRSYGDWSPAVKDYVDFSIMDWMGSKEFDKLLKIVEPYEFKELFDKEKLIINGTIDEFFLPDSWKFYWEELPKKKYLQYVPNGNHGLFGTYSLQNVFSFYYYLINGISIPKMKWKIKNNYFNVKVDTKLEYQISLWKVNNDKRDFRIWEIGRSWVKIPIQKSINGEYKIIAPSGKGFTSSLIEVVFNKDSDNPLTFTTGTLVLPDTYAFESFKPKFK